uniref:Cytochrome c oxidase subunit 3 n=1 Tax=Holarthrothrips indicus TaxID=1965675 RepID=A0A8A5L5I5_9NEOP|nr:cytochrome c oxidase subunit 3 [Holarthrothrips indicus]
MNQNHPFHLVTKSPWPILGSIGTMLMTFSMADYFNGGPSMNIFLALTILMLVKIQWWRDIVREATFENVHTKEVLEGLKWGMILFITSEVFFFVSFFWAFFHSSLSPDSSIGAMWPCMGIKSFNPMGIPMLNTLILLTSGITVTWSHHSLMMGNMKSAKFSLLLTCMLGVYFSIMQLYEYKMASFTIADSVYGSTFYMATGFHGIHVLVGTIFLTTCLLRMTMNHFSSHHHFGFEAAAWYWHFVDVVWLFLYIFIYWWGS